MMRKLYVGAVAAVLLAGAASAQTFKAENGVLVNPIANGFSVTGDAGLGARGIWCAAADYARRHVGARSAQRLYIAEGRTAGLGQRSPVQFTLSSEGLTPSSVFVLGASLSKAGANLSVGHAYSFCADGKLARGGLN